MKSLILSLLISQGSWAMDYETTVTEKVFDSSSKVIITQDDIKKSGAESVTQLLNAQANINFASTSRGFKSNEMFFRGGDSGHILIIVDGVPIYDATTTQRTLNLNFLNLKSIRQIQVIKGSQSVIYGGQALAGVIKIETFARETKATSSVSLDFGTPSYHQLGLSQNFNLSDYSSVYVGAQNQGRLNASPVKDSTVRYPNIQNQGELGYTKKSYFNYYLRTKYVDDSTQIPTTLDGSTPTDTEDFFQRSKQLHSSVVFELPELRNTQIVLGHQKSQRLFEQFPSTSRNYNGESFHYRLDTDLYRSDNLKAYVGTSGSKEFFKFEDLNTKQNEEEQLYYGAYAKFDYDFDSDIQFSAGVRNDWLSFKSIGTYQVGAKYRDTRIEYSTGVRGPSLFQKFAAPYGNPELLPETSSTATLSQDFKYNSGIYSVSIFESYFNNSVGTTGSPLRFYNIAQSRAKGVENSIEHRASETVTIAAAHTYQEAWDINSANWLDKRGLQSVQLRATYAHEKDITTLQFVGQSERSDQGTKLPGYVTLNAFHSYQLTPTFSYSIKFFNLMNQKLQESRGFYGEGMNVVFGLEYFN